ncbi:MAG: hypothetical protein JXR07_14800 [Reichenbachiella sp.]
MKIILAFSLIFLTCGMLLAQEQQERTRQVVPTDSTKSGYTSNVKVGNPTNKEVEMELNDYALPNYRYDLKYSDFWFDWKKKLNEKARLQLSINYTGVYMGATSKIAEENAQSAASGIFDMTLKWNVYKKDNNGNTGSIVFWTDWRHLYFGDVSPQFLFLETGSGTMGATKFREFNFHVLEFYYHQTMFKNSWDVVIGKIDLPDWFNFNGLAHPMLHFTDLAFSVSPTVGWSNPGFGVAAGGWLTKKKNFALVLGVNDVAGVDLNNPGFMEFGTDQFFRGNLLKMAELQYTPSRSKYYYNRIAATFWHSDELTITDESYFQTPSSKGFNIQGTWVIEEKMVPTASFGLSDGDSGNSLSTVNVSLSNAWWFPNHDLFGVGINYSSPSNWLEDSYPGARAQFLSEVFYRWTWSKTTAITPLVKFVVNPSLDPSTDFMMYYGVRGRISI